MAKEKIFSLILAVPADSSEVSAVLVAIGDTLPKQLQNPLKYLFFSQ